MTYGPGPVPKPGVVDPNLHGNLLPVYMIYICYIPIKKYRKCIIFYLLFIFVIFRS